MLAASDFRRSAGQFQEKDLKGKRCEMRNPPSDIRGGVRDEENPHLSGGRARGGAQSGRGGPALFSSVQVAIEEARREEAKVIQSMHRSLKSISAEDRAALAESMTALVRQIHRRLLDHVREIFLAAIRSPFVNFSHEMLAICRMRLLRYFLESKSRCLNASRRFGFEMDSSAAQDAIQFASLIDAMDGIFEILENTVELDIPPHRWGCGEPKGGE